MTLTVGSLFSGIGGLDLGLERAGMKVLWQVEKDPYARRVLAKRWPTIDQFEDIRECCGRGCGEPGNDGHLLPVDLICGGFPCQDISVAGKGAGIKEGTRSGLWIEYARIVRELRPRYVLVENVPALRSRGLDRVLGDLAACGYDASWQVYSAADFGSVHRRERLFIVAHVERRPLRLEQGWGGRPERKAEALARLAGEAGVTARTRGVAAASRVGGTVHGVPARVDRLRCLGNAVVPQVAEFIGRRILAHAADSVSEPRR